MVVGDQEGIVTDITSFNTRLENFDGEFVILPNDRVTERSITDRSRKGLLRLTLDVGVDYDTDIDRAKELARESMVGADEVIVPPPPQAVPKSFGDSAVVPALRFWIDHPTPPRKGRAGSAGVRGGGEKQGKERRRKRKGVAKRGREGGGVAWIPTGWISFLVSHGT